MLEIVDVVIDDKKTIGENPILVEVKPKFRYENNQKTEEIVGYAYIIVLPDKRFEKLSVKIDGKQQMESPECGVPVEFDNLEIFIYRMREQYMVGARATGVHMASQKP